MEHSYSSKAPKVPKYTKRIRKNIENLDNYYVGKVLSQNEFAILGKDEDRNVPRL